ncbi:MAG: crotonase/enoyl-CoA hydratase family protein [Actinomycetota bacterium]
MSKVLVEREGPVVTITINRPEVRNAFDPETAALLADAFRDFAADDELKVAVLTGTGGDFSTGADLKALSRGETPRLEEDGDSPVGPVRMRLRKPVIAAVAGYAVAGGMALALWADLRVVERSATFGMPDRKVGVPIVGGVTVTLPRIVGLSHAMDIILTGRMVDADDAYRMGIANRLVEDGTALDEARALAHELADLPWDCLVNDRLSLIEGMDLPRDAAELNEFRQGMKVFGASEMLQGTTAFTRRKEG